MTSAEESILAEARTEVSYADHKASMVLAALGIGFGAVLGGFLAGSWRPSDLAGWHEITWWIASAFAASSLVLAATAVWPRYRRPKTVTQVHYWGEVASFDSVGALGAFLDANKIDPTERTREQMWQLSKIVGRKYRALRCSFVAAGIGVGLYALIAVSKI